MARGTPDWFASIGRSAIGIQSSELNISVANYTGAFDIPALTAAQADLPEVPSGEKHLMVGAEISCQNSDTVMLLELIRKSNSYCFNHCWFVTNKYLDLKQYAIPAGDAVRLRIYNYHSSNTINFRFTLYWITVKE